MSERSGAPHGAASRIVSIAALAVTLAVLAGLAVACRGGEASTPRARPEVGGVRLVLLVVPGGVSAEALSARLPGRVAGSSLVFTDHVSESPVPAVAFASVFSGGDATHHGVREEGDAIAAGASVITELFRGRGFETYAWLAHPGAARAIDGRGLRGEDLFDGPLTADHPAFRTLLDRLRDDPGGRALVLSACADGDGPDALESFVGLVDAVDESGLGEASLVALAGAYPEERTAELDPSAVDVPLLLRSRKLGLRDGLYEAVTRSADVLPTLAGLLLLEMPDEPTLSGVNLTPAILGALEPPALIARSHDGRSGRSAMSVALTSRELFYRLASGGDRGRDEQFPIEVYARSGAGERAEPSNLADPQNPLHRRMLIELEGYRSILSADPDGGGVPSAAGE